MATPSRNEIAYSMFDTIGKDIWHNCILVLLSHKHLWNLMCACRYFRRLAIQWSYWEKEYQAMYKPKCFPRKVREYLAVFLLTLYPYECNILN